ncbi:RNA polymerase sigma factor [Spirosoma harenae]
MNNSLTDEEMIRHYLPHQPNECFEKLYNRYVGKVYRRCLSMTKNAEQAQDFTQDIFLKVFHKLDAFQQRSSFSTWLYAIAYNYCADQIRVAKRLPTVALATSLEQTWTESMDAQIHEDTLQLVQQAMDRLSSQERIFLRLKYEDGLSVEEIAQLYDLKLSAVKMRLKRSRERLQLICSYQSGR